MANSHGSMTLQIDRKDLGRHSSGASEHYFMLICIQGLEVGKPTELVLAETIVGRAPNAGLRLPATQISRQHAKLLWMDGYHVIEDMNSANGTFVGGVRITKKRLSPGDIVQFGSNFAFRYSVMDGTQKALMEQLYQSSVLDALTGAYNREYFNSVISTELEQAKVTATELCLLILDIDYFKKINDGYGHPAGDAVLIELVNRIKLRLRPSDVLCRYGGEEFAILLRATPLPIAARLAERFRHAVRKQKFLHGDNAIEVSVSIGCASLACADAANAEALVAVADRRLYVAKNNGRDRVVSSD